MASVGSSALLGTTAATARTHSRVLFPACSPGASPMPQRATFSATTPEFPATWCQPAILISPPDLGLPILRLPAKACWEGSLGGQARPVYAPVRACFTRHLIQGGNLGKTEIPHTHSLK